MTYRRAWVRRYFLNNYLCLKRKIKFTNPSYMEESVINETKYDPNCGMDKLDFYKS